MSGQEDRPARTALRVPLSSAADLVREAVARRSQELEELCPAAIDIEAEVVATLHGRLHASGDASRFRGNRGPGYFRQQLRGEHAVTIGDLARLGLEFPAAVVECLSILAGHLGYDLTPLDPAEVSISEATSGIARSAGDLVGDVTDAQADGVIDPEERARLRSRLDQHQEQVARLQAVLDAPAAEPLRAVAGGRR